MSSTTVPTGVKLKKWKPVRPCRTSSLLTTRLGAVATSVSIPLDSAATLSGIISPEGAAPVSCATRITTGMKMATTPVELITAPRVPTNNISRISRRELLVPALAINRSPIRCTTPVRSNPSPMMKSVAISTTFASANPASASDMLSTPVNGSTVSINSATASMRGRPTANITIAAPSSPRTTISSVVIASPAAQSVVHPHRHAGSLMSPS